jgi:cold-inducible RNA-binding protein
MSDLTTGASVNPAKLFVGNLNYRMTAEDMRAAFSEFGEVVDCIVMTDKFSGRSKGFGFVTFATPEEADAALNALNGKEVMERQIFVSVARPPQPRQDRGDRGGFGGNRGGGGRDSRFPRKSYNNDR